MILRGNNSEDKEVTFALPTAITGAGGLNAQPVMFLYPTTGEADLFIDSRKFSRMPTFAGQQPLIHSRRCRSEQPRQVRPIQLCQRQVVGLCISGARRRVGANDLPRIKTENVCGTQQFERLVHCQWVPGRSGHRHADGQRGPA